MNGKVIALFGVVATISLLSACAPQLARTAYGQEEQQWKGYIQNTYEGWTPPPAPAPNSSNTTPGESFVPDSNENNLQLSPAANQTKIVDLGSQFSDAQTAPDQNNNGLSGISAASQIPQAVALPSTQTPVDGSYTVQKGDSLWSISRKIYKDNGGNWKKLYNANKDKLSSPSSLKAGMVLTIPSAS